MTTAPSPPTAAETVGSAAPEPQTTTSRSSWRTAAAVAIVALAVAIPLRELFRHQGPPMEEGFMLVFPEQVLNGQVPNRDFLHLYGPGSLWFIAGFFKLLGTSLATERLVGLLQLLGVIFGIFALARTWGRRVATCCALVVVLVSLFPVGLAALAWNGAVALGLIGMAVGLSASPARIASTDRTSRIGATAGTRRLVAAGALAGLALLFRPDLIVAVVAGFGALAWSLDRRQRTRLLTGMAAGVAPYLVLVATAGPGHALKGLVLEPVLKLRGGRSLPIPPSTDRLDGALQKAGGLVHPSWPLPTLSDPMQVFSWFVLLLAATVFVAAVGVIGFRRRPGSHRARVLLCVGLFGLGTVPQALQRPDSTHLGWVSYVVLGFLPVALVEAAGLLPGRLLRRVSYGLRSSVAGGLVVVLVVLLVPHFTARTYLDYSRQALFDQGVSRWSANNDGRNFWLGNKQVAREADALLADLDRRARPGATVIVGPADLRKTNYSDAWLYFLLPKLEPGTRYIEMDPGVANADDSGLAGELERSDYYIASHVWDVWDEPNSSQDLGSDAPNRVVRDRYCLRRDYGRYLALYQRCR